MIVAHNMLAMNAQRQFSVTGLNKKKSTEKLSSGYRINRAADDAAGLQISEKMRKQINGLNRGVDNTEAGISLCQVADGALAQVNDMLHRMTELSVQSANGTNSVSDRQAIQREINQLLAEINRIGETTTFNGKPIFQGEGRVSSASRISGLDSLGNIPFSDFTLANMELGDRPFGAASNANTLGLQAIVSNSDSSWDGQTFNLIFGNGSTSISSLRLKYTDENGQLATTVVDLCPPKYSTAEDPNPDNLSRRGNPTVEPSNYSESNGIRSREFNYDDGNGINITITQSIRIDETDPNEKNYVISYDFKNNGSTNVDLEFLFHADTAYNNNDRCEKYFVRDESNDQTNQIGESTIYTSPDSSLVPSGGTYSEVPDSFSIIDTEQALAFTEKVSFPNGKPDSLCMGHYSQICDWSYYDSLNANLGRPTSDLGFALYYNLSKNGTLGSGDSRSLTFNYGIANAETDKNLTDIFLTKDVRTIVNKTRSASNFWIQSGCDTMDGIPLKIGQMDAEILGIDNLNVMSEKQATNSITRVSDALAILSAQRSEIGAQQNRLEHTVANESNTVENTTAAESRIRDTDMAEEMVNYSKHNILEQAGLSMMAQANQNGQHVLALLQ